MAALAQKYAGEKRLKKQESPCHSQPGKSLGQQAEALIIAIPQPGHWPGSWV